MTNEQKQNFIAFCDRFGIVDRSKKSWLVENAEYNAVSQWCDRNSTRVNFRRVGHLKNAATVYEFIGHDIALSARDDANKGYFVLYYIIKRNKNLL